jgi:hypothetical protein
MKHAYINADGLVVQVIVGALQGQAHDLMLRDYGVLFGAVRCIQVDDTVTVWAGGRYDEDAGFLPPPEPEPLPEPLPEPQLEPEI